LTDNSTTQKLKRPAFQHLLQSEDSEANTLSIVIEWHLHASFDCITSKWNHYFYSIYKVKGKSSI